MQLQIKRLCEEAILPVADPSGENAGIDLHTTAATALEPGRVTVCPTGITTCFPPGYVGLLRDRSGLGSRGIHLLGGVIDSGYRGEWKVLLINLGSETYHVEPGDRVAQLIFHRVELAEIEEVAELPESLRGAAGFGSSGR